MSHPVDSGTVRRWTTGDLERLPSDGNRYEIIEGALFVTPAPQPDEDPIGADAEHAVAPTRGRVAIRAA